MSCGPFFSLTPLNPYVDTFDRENPTDPVLVAYFFAYGVHTSSYPNSLTDHYNNDRLLLWGDPVLDNDQPINSIEDDIKRKCAIRIEIRGYNIGPARQYLLVFRFMKAVGSPIAQFFIGNQPVRAEAIIQSSVTQSHYEVIAILLDAPDSSFFPDSGATIVTPVHITVRLAAPDNSYNHGFYVMGVDCYLL